MIDRAIFRADLEWSQMAPTKRKAKRAGKLRKKREGPPSPLKVGRPTKKNGGKAGSCTQATTQVADMRRVGVWKRKLGGVGTELRHSMGDTWSYDAMRVFLFMIVKAIQEASCTTWEGAKEAITSSIGMVHRVSGLFCGNTQRTLDTLLDARGGLGR